MSLVLIKGGCVLSMDPRVGNHRVGDILIEDDRIAEVGPNLRVRAAEVVDARDSIVMPGFVDAHRHLSRSLLRGLGDVPDAENLPTGAHFGADDVYAATLVGLLGAVEAGTTTVVDWSEVDHVDASLQAHADAGVRTLFVRGAIAGREDEWRTHLDKLPEDGPATTLITHAAGSPNDARHDPDDWREARRLGLPIHAHIGAGDQGSAARLAEAGVLSADVTLVHCATLDGRDFDAIASAGASVVLAPASEMTRGLRPPPMQELIDRGIRPGLGVDDELTSPGDMFAPMRASISLQHATYFDRKLAGKGGLPNLLTTREVIRYTTIDGATAVGLGDVTGSLTPGKQADVIVLRADRPNIVPVNDPIGAVVWGMDTSNVHWVFVAGRPLMRDGVLHADRESIAAMAIRARERVARAAGLLVPAGAPE